MRLRLNHMVIMLVSVLLIFGALALATMPLVADDVAQGFATNTSPPPTPVITTPDAPSANYALRLWLEADLIDLLLSGIQRLSSGDIQAYDLVPLLQFELEYRFPGAPGDPADREKIILAMLSAPRGSVDMRTMVRPLVETQLNNNTNEQALEFDGFSITTQPARVNNDAITDAVIHIVYPANATDPASILYEDYVMAVRDSAGRYTIVSTTADSPAAPYGEIESITLDRVSDVNRDGQDEMVLIIDDGQVNQRIRIMGYRNGQAIDYVLPNQEIRVGELLFWPTDDVEDTNPTLSVYHYQAVDSNWGCIYERPIGWNYENNFYRPSVGVNTKYESQGTLACIMYEAEPIFALPFDEGIDFIEATLANFNADNPAYARAQMTLVMLYTLNGQLNDASTLVNSIQPTDENEAWVTSQRDEYLSLISASGNTALDICEGLLIANLDGACDIDSVLGRYFEDNPPTIDEPLVDQLETRGLPVLEQVTVTEVGKVPRTVINFNLFGSSWWAFAPRGENSYTAEITNAPAGFEAAAFPLAMILPPDSALEAIFVDNNPVGALDAIDNVLQNNAGIPLAPSARYIQALSFDLAGDRQRARQEYYDLWQAYPTNSWGQFAAEHLERR